MKTLAEKLTDLDNDVKARDEAIRNELVGIVESLPDTLPTIKSLGAGAVAVSSAELFSTGRWDAGYYNLPAQKMALVKAIRRAPTSGEAYTLLKKVAEFCSQRDMPHYFRDTAIHAEFATKIGQALGGVV